MITRRLEEVRLNLDLETLKEQKSREGFVRSSHTGTVLGFHKTIGDTVASGERVGTMIEDSEATQTLQCLAYFPIGVGNRISIGDSALTTPSTHIRSRDGSIRGTVVAVEPYLANEDSLFLQIGNRSVSQRLLANENLKGVRIELSKDKNDVSTEVTQTYEWTGRPPHDFSTIDPGTTANVRIRIASRAPVELAFSTFRQWLYPSGHDSASDKVYRYFNRATSLQASLQDTNVIANGERRVRRRLPGNDTWLPWQTHKPQCTANRLRCIA